MSNTNKNSALNVFNETYDRMQLLYRVPFTEIYPSEFDEITTALKDEISNNCILQNETQFNIYLNWVKDKIEKTYMHHPSKSFIEKWVKEYNLDEKTGRVNYDEMEEIALREHPKMIIGGGSAYSREWDYERMRKIADEVGALLMIDMAHPAGLIAAGLLKNPVKYAHIVTTTTHKTLRGPRGGIIMLGKDFDNPWGYTTKKGIVKKMSQLINSAVFPGNQGGPLEHVIAAKAVGFGENLEPSWKEYASQVKTNAAVLAQDLINHGFGIVSGGTDNHSMLLDLRQKYPDLTGKVAETALVAADITVNKNKVPYDERSAFQTSGIRLGTAAMTTRGAKEDMMHLIADLIDEVLKDPENDKVIKSVKEKVNATMKDYPLFAY